jgi:ABC-2 type transport system permease protein
MNNKVYSTILNSTKSSDLTQKIFNGVLPIINADLNRSYLTISPIAKAKILDSNQEFSSNMLILFSLLMALTMSISILIEGKRGTLNRIYSTATNRLSFYFGKLLATFTISIIQVLCFITVSSIFIGANYGNYYSLIPIILIHTVLITSITAILISLFKNTTVMGGFFSFLILIMSTLAGSFYPSEDSPGFIREASHFTINYWLKSLYSSNMMGDPFLSIASILITILILCCIIISLGAAKLKYTE